MPISAVDAIGPAFRHARQQLTQPFRLAQWARLALVGLLAGELSSSGCSVSDFRLPQHSGGGDRFFPAGLPQIDPSLYIGLIAFLAVAGLVFWLLLIYVNSMMRFVLFDSILEKDCHIRRGWGRYTGAGFRYFLWQLAFAFVMVVGLITLIGIPAAFGLAMGWFKDSSQHLAPLILGGMVLFFLLFAFFVCVVVIGVFSKDFVVPQMALEKIGAIEAWRRLLGMITREKASYAGYAGMKIVMAIAAAVMIGIVNTIVLLVIVVLVGGLGLAAVVGGKIAGLTWNAYTITLAIVAGSIVVPTILYIFSLISVPAIAFFPAYSIYFFAARYQPLALALNPAPPPPPEAPQFPSGPPPSPSPPPFLPPEPDPIG